jgi:hypothetical protein
MPEVTEPQEPEPLKPNEVDVPPAKSTPPEETRQITQPEPKESQLSEEPAVESKPTTRIDSASVLQHLILRMKAWRFSLENISAFVFGSNYDSDSRITRAQLQQFLY